MNSRSSLKSVIASLVTDRGMLNCEVSLGVAW